MDRPADLFGREREWSVLEGFVEDDRPGATLGIVVGHRRQGKSFLLQAVCEQTGGFYFQAIQATPAESLRRLGERLAERLGAPAPLVFTSWAGAVDALLALGRSRPVSVVLDDVQYLLKSSPELPSVLQAAFGPRRAERAGSKTRLILSGSALTVMGKLFGGSAPLSGRAGMELMVPTFDYRTAREFWGIAGRLVATLTHAVVGGTPAYRREYARDDVPRSRRDFDDWVVRAVLDPSSPLFTEARYLLSDTDMRDPSLYHSTLAAVAQGYATRGSIASFIGRKSTDVAHPLTVLEEAGFLVRDDDLLRERRPVWRITEPFVAFYHAIMRPAWAQLERPGRAEAVWRAAQQTFQAHVIGPHFQQLCRTWAAAFADPETFGTEEIGRVGRGVVNDPGRRTRHELDVVVVSPGQQRLLCIGEAKWGEVMGEAHLSRLRRARTLLAARSSDAADAILACYGGAGFTPGLREAAERGEVVLVDLEKLYEQPPGWTAQQETTELKLVGSAAGWLQPRGDNAG